MKNQTKRLRMLKSHLQIIESILDINKEWNKVKIGVAKYVFCLTMMQTCDEVVYQLCATYGRDVVEELKSCINLLESKK